MKLKDISWCFFPVPHRLNDKILYVFEDIESAENWIANRHKEYDIVTWDILMVVNSARTIEFTVREEWCNANVTRLYAVDEDLIAVVIEKEEKK